MKLAWLEAVALAAAAVNAQQQEDDLAYSPPFYPSPWAKGEDEWAQAHEKAVELVSQLTLDEKVNLTTGTGWMQGRCVGMTGSVPRLGLEGICLQDSPLGIRFTDHNTPFPAGITVAATWDKQLAYHRGHAMGEEFRDKGIDLQLGPSLGPLGKFPKGGRNWEGFAPDPALTGFMTAETVKGIQDAGVIACAKHYIMNEQEHFRQYSEAQGYGFNISGSLSSNVDDRTMHEMYLWPFADAVRAGVGSIMCSYNQINNSYGCSNSHALNMLLKAELDFQGFVLSDWGAHHSGVSDALAGMDMSMPGDVSFNSDTSFYGTNLTVAVLNGTIPQWRVDDMAVRIMSSYYKVGRDQDRVSPNFGSWTSDEYGYLHAAVGETYTKLNEFVNVRRNHAKVVRDIDIAGTVLLKNDGALPLTGDESFVAVLGEDAGPSPWGANGCSDHGCDLGTLGMGWGSGTSNYPFQSAPEQAIQHEVTKGLGSVITATDNWDLDKMAAIASKASVALVFVNADSGEGYITVDENAGDRKNMTFWRNGDEVIKTASEKCNNTIVVMHTVGPVLVDSWYDNPNITGIIWAGLPAQESGNAITEVLYGRANPGGKTPFTWGKTHDDYGVSLVYEPNNGHGAPQDTFTEGVFIDYRHFDKYDVTPIYEFGYGLSYTSFAFSDLKVSKMRAGPYKPTKGMTRDAPTYGGPPGKISEYLYPSGLNRIAKFIYPWLNSTNLKESSNDPDYGMENSEYLPGGATDGSPQHLLPASGAPGGNRGLYEDLIHVSAKIKNTGKVTGDEVPQLYVSLGGSENAVVALRQFDRITLVPGEEREWETTLNRRDLSNWDTESQNWVISEHPKQVHVGSSSRKLPLKADLPRVH